MFKSSLVYLLPAILWALFIFIVSWTVAGINLPESLFDLISTDKAAHATVYAIFIVLWLWGIKKTDGVYVVAPTLIALFCMAYGFLMEVLQFYYFPGRYFEFLDIVANISGVLIGWFIFYLFSTKKISS